MRWVGGHSNHSYNCNTHIFARPLLSKRTSPKKSILLRIHFWRKRDSVHQQSHHHHYHDSSFYSFTLVSMMMTSIPFSPNINTMSVVRTLLLSILVILSLHQETPHNHHHHYHHHYFSIIGRVKAQTNVNSNTFIDKYLIPRPKEVTWEETATKLLSFYKLNFVLYVKGTKVDRTQFPVVDTALKRYEAWMFKLFETKGSPTNYDSDFLFYNEDVVIQITEDVTYPVLDVLNIDESYELTIRTRGIVIKSTSQFGFLRALETFSQMIRRNINDQFFFIPNTPIYIKDSPRFKHRGLMIDVARNYIYPETIKEIIDLMSFDKLNVLHIHFTDAQSFPYQMYGSFSDLSDKGSFSKELVYSKEDIASLIEYAYFRGIQIIPEFDMPGHTKSFSFAYPEVVSSCPKRLATNVNNYPLNVAESTTFDIIEAILGQWQSKDTLMEKTKISNSILLSIMHLGGDEVTKACWTDENPIIFNFFNGMCVFFEFIAHSNFSHLFAIPTMNQQS